MTSPALDADRSRLYPVQQEAWTSLLQFILASSWRHQLSLIALTVTVFLLEVVPLEIQRRIVNDVVKHRPYTAILWLAGSYFAVILVQGATKLSLNLYRVWVGERAKRDLRARIYAATDGDLRSSAGPSAQGTAVSMTVGEVEPVGNFVGMSLSEPLLQSGILASVISYLVHVDVWMGAAALTLFLPQLIFVPLMQHAMNRGAGLRVRLLRRLAAGIIGQARKDMGRLRATAGIVRLFKIDMQIFRLKFTMNFLMNLCSHLQVIAALLLGAWWVSRGQLEMGGVVAFLSGLGRINDPWGDLVNYFREYSNTKVKFDLLMAALHQSGDATS